VTRPLVYVAGPITGDPWGCVRKATDAARVVDAYCQFDAYLPQLSVLHEIVDRRRYEYWVNVGLNVLSRCDGLVRLPGDSQGADRETEYAKDLGLPVLYRVDSTFSDLREWETYVRAQHAYRQETDL